MSAVFFVIMCAAITYVLTESVIGGIYRAIVRRLASQAPVIGTYAVTLAYCPACTGFWVGFGLYWLEWAPWTLGAPRPEMLAGCAGLLIGLLLPRLTTFDAFSIEVSEQDDGTTKSREEPEQSSK